MGNMQKVENGTLTLQIRGGGPLGTLLAVRDAAGNVRGYVQNPGITLLEKYAGKLMSALLSARTACSRSSATCR